MAQAKSWLTSARRQTQGEGPAFELWLLPAGTPGAASPASSRVPKGSRKRPPLDAAPPPFCKLHCATDKQVPLRQGWDREGSTLWKTQAGTSASGGGTGGKRGGSQPQPCCLGLGESAPSLPRASPPARHAASAESRTRAPTRASSTARCRAEKDARQQKRLSPRPPPAPDKPAENQSPLAAAHLGVSLPNLPLRALRRAPRHPLIPF